MALSAWSGGPLDRHISVTPFLLLVVSSVAVAQTRIDPEQLQRMQLDWSWFRVCHTGASSWIPLGSKGQGTRLTLDQLSNYGLYLEDGQTLKLKQITGGTITLRLTAPVSGSISLRFSGYFPNFALSGFTSADLDIRGGNGWAVHNGGFYSKPPAVSVTVSSGQLSSVVMAVYRTSCGQWP